MAFVARNSKFFIVNKLRNSSFHSTYMKSLNFPNNSKFSVYSILSLASGHQYSTVTKLHLSRPRHGAKYTFSSSSVSIHHHLSTDSKLENLEVIVTDPVSKALSSHTINAGDQTLEKVLFVEPHNISTSSEEIITDIAPTISTDIASALSSDISSISAIVEPSLSSLGLAGWTPVGIVQQCFEYIHIGLDMPWWLTIVAATAITRVFMFPLFVKTQKNSVKFSNYMPQLQYLQAKFNNARKSGNQLEATRLGNEIMAFMKQNDINPLKNALVPLAQAPVFLSFFLSLRSMAKLPVESMKEGGIWWITDLTIPDPYYIMPVIACSTLYVILKIGAESGIKMENMKMARYFLQAMPVVLFPFCINFPSAVLFYWCTNNLLTLSCVSMIKIPAVRQFLKMPAKQKIHPKFEQKQKGFIEGIKEAYKDQKILQAVDDRTRIDEIRFRKAGTGPIPRTYAYDPTKPRPAAAAQKAKGT